MESSETTSFRDRPINMLASGNRKWIYAKQPKGKWYTRRTIFGWFCMLFLVFAPFIKINGNPLMLFDVVHRKFFIFGQLIWAQDSYLLALIMLVSVVSIVLFTVVFGRLWCGWACPQTLFMEMVFRRIEYLFEGNYRSGNRKNTKKNSLKTIAKHLAFFITSVIISNVFLNWFVGPTRLLEIISSPISENLLGFVLMMGISTFYYFIYSYFREQVCTMFCPYGRMQGVLLDSKSIAVVYDYKRGEPRGAKAQGDCIACNACISVCPTGIDIKDGSQLECINCTACIDECNIVMKKIGKPENLIRFDSVSGIETGKRQIFNARTYAYSAVLLVLIIVLGVTLFNRTAIDSTILRVPGTTYQQVDTDLFSNIYNVKIINKTQEDKELELRLLNPNEGEIQFAGNNNLLEKDAKFEGVIIVKLMKNSLSGKSTSIEIGIFTNNILLETYTTNFIGPTH